MRKMAVVLLCFILIFTVSSCGSPSEADLLETRNTDISPDLTFDHSMPLDYAEEFAVDYYNDGYVCFDGCGGYDPFQCAEKR